MHSAWSSGSFLRVSKFLQIKETWANFWGNQFCRKSELFLHPYLHPYFNCFNFKSFKDWHSLSFISFQRILFDSGLSFLDFSNFYKLRREDLISRTNFAEGVNYFVPLLYFKFKSFMDLEFFSFIKFQYIFHDSGALFSESSNFCKLKSGDLICGRNQFWRKSEWFGTSFSISILKVLRTKIICHSLHINAFCSSQEYLSQTFEISAN